LDDFNLRCWLFWNNIGLVSENCDVNSIL
jgi:hypothetical protein